ILRRLKQLPGFGEQKAKIFLALLGKQCGLQAPGWREATGEYGADGAMRSIADVVDEATLLQVRETKRALKAAAKQKARATRTGPAPPAPQAARAPPASPATG